MRAEQPTRRFTPGRVETSCLVQLLNGTPETPRWCFRGGPLGLGPAGGGRRSSSPSSPARPRPFGELGEILVGNLDREIQSLEFAREGLVLLGTISLGSQSEQQICICISLGFRCQRLRRLPTSPRPCLHEKAPPIGGATDSMTDQPQSLAEGRMLVLTRLLSLRLKQKAALKPRMGSGPGTGIEVGAKDTFAP